MIRSVCDQGEWETSPVYSVQKLTKASPFKEVLSAAAYCQMIESPKATKTIPFMPGHTKATPNLCRRTPLGATITQCVQNQAPQ